MQPTLSVEEFQRFQSQLLDLRESQIQATDARLRAETRAKQLEAQVSELRTALSAVQPTVAHQTRLDQLTKENEQLRVKLLSTESAFQLQSSTLRAECLHLSAELDRLTALLNTQKHHQTTQTDGLHLVEVPVQTDFLSPPSGLSQLELDEIRTLESRITSLTAVVHTQLEVKVAELEHRFQTEIDAVLTQIARYQATEMDLQKELNAVKQSAQQAREAECDARNQLATVKNRSEKLNRELRRQLARLLRPDVERSSLRQLSIYSSSSSLSSATNHTTGTLSNDNTSSVTTQQQIQEPLDTSSTIGQTDIPVGYFPMSDVKTLVDRLSEVQEENCTLRRQVQRLDSELMAKTRALQVEMSNRLTSVNSTSPSVTTDNSTLPTIHITSHSGGDNGVSLSRATNGLFSPLSSMFSQVLKSTHADPTTLSSANLETVNRLKRMCENLLTENMQLSAQLEAITQESSR